MTNEQKEVLRKIIYAVETGGQVYGRQDYSDFTEAYTNSSEEHAITIGAGQWYGPEAKTLLERIHKANPTVWEKLDTAGVWEDVRSADWSCYNISDGSDKAQCIVKLISCTSGIKCQDALLDEQMEVYVQEAIELGVTDPAAQAMCANFRHQGGLSAMKRILAKADLPYTLDNLYEACQTDTGNQVGAYKSRQRFAYNSLKKYFPEGEDDMATKQEAINAVIKTAKAEVGYLEKASNSQLDSKTANAGYNNYTKYWRDVYPDYQGQPWCACFVTWIFDQVFGKANTKTLLKHYPYTYCPTLGELFTKYANPQVGDIVIFWRNGEFAHTGIVIAVNGDNFTTIEGNTSSGAGIEPNGGAVCQKSYNNNDLPGTKFCRVDWEKAAKLMGNTGTEEKQETGTTEAESNIDPNTSVCAVRINKTTKCYLGAGTSYGWAKLFPQIQKGSLADLMKGSAKDSAGKTWYLVKLAHPTEGFVTEYIQEGTFRYLK